MITTDGKQPIIIHHMSEAQVSDLAAGLRKMKVYNNEPHWVLPFEWRDLFYHLYHYARDDHGQPERQ